jgi:6-phosphogluconolactonase
MTGPGFTPIATLSLIFLVTAACAGKGSAGGAPTPGPGRQAFVYTSGSDTADVRVLRFDLDSGALTPVGTADAGKGSGYLAWDPWRKYLYGINRSPAKVLAWRINPADGTLAKINEVTVTGADGATHISVHPSGKWVLVAYFGSGHLSSHPVRDDGGVGDPVDLQATAPQAHHAMTPDDGRFVLVPCRDGNAISRFAIDTATGKLTASPKVDVPPGAGPRHLAFHPALDFVYVINETNGTITSYRFDPSQGQLSDPETIPSVPPGTPENAAAHVVVHPSGRWVYGSNRQSSSISIFDVNDAGRLVFRGVETGGGMKKPRDFLVDPTGKWMLVASQDTAQLLVFQINDDGGLSYKGSAAVQTKPTFVGLIPR